MPKPATQVKIDSLNHEGRGVTTVKNKKVFVRGALTDEVVDIQFTRNHKQYAEAKTVEVIEASAQRIAAQCQHFGTCGGCLLQHLPPELQIEHKQSVLADNFKHFGKVAPKTWLPPLTGPVWQYRHKARLSVKYVAAKEKIVIGFREIDGRFVTDMVSCPILHPAVGEKLPQLAKLIEATSIKIRIPQLEIAIGDTASAVIIRHLEPLTADDLMLIKDFAETHKLHIYLQPKGPNTIHKLWPNDGDERLSYQLTDLNLTYKFHPADFTQVNPAINAKMVSLTIKMLELTEDDHVLDLFCGLGNFSLAIAQQAGQVVGVEGDEEMVKRATENAALNQLDNCQFFAADLFDLSKDFAWKKTYTKLLLDPPRTGAETVVKSIKSFGTPDIVYVSCNPATLARDAGILCQQGYTLEQAGIMDMFPHTGHVESIAVFKYAGK